MNFEHKSIMLDECLNGLNINPDATYLDGTLGGAGHSLEICKRLSKKGRLIGIDQDDNALIKAASVLEDYKEQTLLIKGNFFNTKELLNAHGVEPVSGILLDLGVSSHQLDEPSRGFSYMNDGPLDMRMDTSKSFTALDVVNKYSEKKLSDLIFAYGEEKWAKRIAEFIVAERNKNPIKTTFELVTIIKKAIPKAVRADGPHPAKRTFQAIRIEVNMELNPLEKAIHNLVDLLEKDGRICIISFHSLEDRIIKTAFKKMENPCTCPKDIPYCVCAKEKTLELVSRKPIEPSEKEIEENPRARSAKLRVGKKV